VTPRPDPVTAADDQPLDPIERAVYDRYRELGCPSPVDPTDPDDAACMAVETVRVVRRAVLDRRDDGERLERIRGWVGTGHVGAAAPTVSYLLAALADAETARRQAEADRDGIQRMFNVAAERMRLAEEREDVAKADRDALALDAYRVEQILGRALKYPPYPADWGAPEGDVCVGEHAPTSLADEAAAAISERDMLAGQVERVRALADGHGQRVPPSMIRDALDDGTAAAEAVASVELDQADRAATEGREHGG
jgi:hypothetical protein